MVHAESMIKTQCIMWLKRYKNEIDAVWKKLVNLFFNKAYRPNAHLLYIVMHYNGNIMVIMVLYNFTLLFQPLEQTLITQNPNLCGTTI